MPFDDEDEAVAIANGTEFGLYDYVFSGDTARASRVARQLRTGNVGINTAQRNHEAPFGGFKMSGVGRDGGSFGLHAYSRAAVDRLARLVLLWRAGLRPARCRGRGCGRGRRRRRASRP